MKNLGKAVALGLLVTAVAVAFIVFVCLVVRAGTAFAALELGWGGNLLTVVLIMFGLCTGVIHGNLRHGRKWNHVNY